MLQILEVAGMSLVGGLLLTQTYNLFHNPDRYFAQLKVLYLLLLPLAG